MASCWGQCGVMLGSRWGHVGVMLGSVWGHVGVSLKSCWGQIGVMLGQFGSCWGQFGVSLVSCWDHFGVMMGNFGNVVGSFWDHSGQFLRSFWGVLVYPKRSPRETAKRDPPICTASVNPLGPPVRSNGGYDFYSAEGSSQHGESRR